MDYILVIKHLSKNFGATKALQDVSLEVKKGEIHAILGENGAGKSTLIKILSGVYNQDSGEIYFCGNRYISESVVKARSLGISAAFQELSLLPNITIAENLFLPNIQKNALHIISQKKAVETAKSFFDQFGIDEIEPSQKIGHISLAHRQRLETVRAMVCEPKLLILDEATAALFNPEWLFNNIRRFVFSKELTVIFITHRLREARYFCDRLTILKNGFSVVTKSFDEIRDEEIFRYMTGKSDNNLRKSRSKITFGAEIEKLLAVEDLRSSKGMPEGKGISLTLRRGEILGLAGLEGQGQRQIFDMLGGMKPILGGRIEMEGCPVSIRTPCDTKKIGLFLVPEERKTEGIFPGIETAHNISISILSKIKTWLSIINRKREFDYVKDGSEKVQLDVEYLKRTIDALSGGNQQKAIVARALVSDAKCLLLFDPTRGVDVGTKQNIYRVIYDFANNGGAVLFYSTEIPEIVKLCDRCAVFYNNQIRKEISGEALSEPAILEAMLGYTGDRGGVSLSDERFHSKESI